MSKPNNPFELVIKNKFFSNGLTENNIYNYWLRWKTDILTHLRSHRVMFYLSPEMNKTIIRRYATKEQTPYYLNDENYNKLLTGRTTGILRLFDDKSNFGVIDIDSQKENSEISSESSFDKVKDLTEEVAKYFTRLYDCSILYTGKNGFHVYCHFNKPMLMSKIKEILENHINSVEFLKNFLSERKDSRPNIDLSSNMRNGAIIIRNSLNRIGLPAVELYQKNLRSFKRESLIEDVLKE